MKILVCSQQYWPEYWRIVDVCEELAKLGHSVTVVCGLPNYDTGFTRTEYLHGRNRVQTHNDVSIFRCYEHERKRNSVDLFLNYQSFSKNSTKLIEKIPGDFDVVLLNGLSPVMQSLCGLYYAEKHNVKTLLYCFDVWPASLAAGGIKPFGLTKPIYDHYKKVSSKIYNRCDEILVTSKDFIEYLSQTCNVPVTKMAYLPQYSEEIFANKNQFKSVFEAKHNFVFAGNIGKAQNIDTIIDAASAIHDPEIKIHIYGSGSELKRLTEKTKDLKLSNVVFHGRIPFTEMPAVYAEADAMLVSLSKDEYAKLVIPGKIQTYLAAGKPVISACDGAVMSLLKEANCGFCVSSGDSMGLAAAIERMAALTKQEKEAFASNALNYSNSHFDRKSFFSYLETSLTNLAKK
jgi:glycosyltransferase involved in cell wall biosynthesis